MKGLLTGRRLWRVAVVGPGLDFVDKYGFVPNAARIYYLNRSQPPFLTMMVKIYVEYTNDTELLHRALPLLEKELSNLPYCKLNG